MQDYFLESRGIAYRTNAFVEGRTTLLFVHGLSGSASSWYAYEPLFEHSFNVVTFDMRGHGLSVHPTGYTMAEFVEDIRALLEHLHVERCAIVSHSFGALVAMEFVKTYPAKVDRLVLLAPPYRVHEFGVSRFFFTLGAALAFMPLRVRAYKRTNYAQYVPTGDYSPRRIAADVLNMGIRSYLRCMRLAFATGYDPDWALLTVSTLIIQGTADHLVPVAHARALKSMLPHAELIELTGANHLAVLNNVPEVSEAIKKFIGHN